MSSLLVLEWSRAKRKERVGKYWEGAPATETRQQFVNYHIQQFQRLATDPLHFGVMLQFFRELGEMYDRGSRLRDSQAGAA